MIHCSQISYFVQIQWFAKADRKKIKSNKKALKKRVSLLCLKRLNVSKTYFISWPFVRSNEPIYNELYLNQMHLVGWLHTFSCRLELSQKWQTGTFDRLTFHSFFYYRTVIIVGGMHSQLSSLKTMHRSLLLSVWRMVQNDIVN